MTARAHVDRINQLDDTDHRFVTDFALAYLAGAIDESGHISAAEWDEAMRLALGSEVPC